MKRGGAWRTMRSILIFLATFTTMLMARAAGSPPQMEAALALLLILPWGLGALMWREVSASGHALNAKNYAKARQHSRNFLFCMPWLWWLKPFLRICGSTKRDPEAIALSNLGGAEIALGEYKMAQRHLERAMALAPDYALPRYNMGLLNLKTGCSDAAKPWFEKAAQLGHTHPMMDRRMADFDKWSSQLSVMPTISGPDGGPDFHLQILNDDKTPMLFVVFILERVIGLSYEQAKTLMLEIHAKGRGVCGTYNQAETEAKLASVQALATQNGFPLVCEAVPAG